MCVVFCVLFVVCRTCPLMRWCASVVYRASLFCSCTYGFCVARSLAYTRVCAVYRASFLRALAFVLGVGYHFCMHVHMCCAVRGPSCTTGRTNSSEVIVDSRLRSLMKSDTFTVQVHLVHGRLKRKWSDVSEYNMELVFAKSAFLKGGHAPIIENYDEAKKPILLPNKL